MPIVVTDNCRGCRFTECVMVCPVACFHLDERMVVIDNSVCIECRACIEVCPVRAIYDANDLPADKKQWLAINSERAAVLPVVADKQTPLPGAEARKTELGY